MASRAEMLARAAQGAVQAAPAIQAAVAPPPPPAPAPAAPVAAAAPAAARTEPRHEEPKRVPKPHGGGTPRRETPPPPPKPAQDERVRQIAARDIFDSSKAGPIEPKLGRGTPTPGPISASPASLRSRFAGSDLDAMIGETEPEEYTGGTLPSAGSSLLTPADRAAALAQRQGLLDAMQRVAEMRQARGEDTRPSLAMTSVLSGFTGRQVAPPSRLDIYDTHQSIDGSKPFGVPVPVSALQDVAAFRDEVRKRGDDYRAVSRGLAGLEAKAMELEAKSPRLPGVPVSPTLAAVDQVRQQYRKLIAQRRADLAEAGLTDEQIDELGR